MEQIHTSDTDAADGGRSNRGFASMNTDRQREIARKGGRAAHAKGTAHEFTSDEARAAGQKGGQRVSANREHMSRIGRIGGKKSAGKRQVSRDPVNSPDTPGNEGRPGDAADRNDGHSNVGTHAAGAAAMSRN